MSKVAVVTGGASGIGAGVVRQFAADGHQVAVLDRNGPLAEEVAGEVRSVAAGWGRIVTISSQSAQSGAPNMAHYSASKGGVIALTKALAVDLARKGVTVNTIAPSIVDTPMARAATESGDFPGIEIIAPMVPLGRAGVPADIAMCCSYLCGEDSGSYITGQLLAVNGGMYI